MKKLADELDAARAAANVAMKHVEAAAERADRLIGKDTPSRKSGGPVRNRRARKRYTGRR